ncbi:hypothetical protein C7999DRAFT_40389 [Corynascus novoguineensis]|uniref:Vacuolar ATPase assembly protein VMA22 n=1 Tax=Corynascus novoguineensis TaxID=1126955 RepID=A0AAN7CU38_9PEZI|nr:hypothetical protein C7999DRAFT_40389 [Corynascus novoguineensis]
MKAFLERMDTEPDTQPDAPNTQTQTQATKPERRTTEEEAESESQRIDTLLAGYLTLLDEYTALRTDLTALQARIFQDLARANFAGAAERGVRHYGRDYYDERMQAGRRVHVRIPVQGSGGNGLSGDGGRNKTKRERETTSPIGLEEDVAARRVNSRSDGVNGEERRGGEEGGGWNGPVFSVEVYPPPGGEEGQESENSVEQPEGKEFSADEEGSSGARGKEINAINGGGEQDGSLTTSETDDDDVKRKPKPKPADPLRWFGILTPLPLRQAQSNAIRAVEEIIPRLATLSAKMAGVELEVRRARKRRAKAEKAEERRLAELGDKMAKVNVAA